METQGPSRGPFANSGEERALARAGNTRNSPFLTGKGLNSAATGSEVELTEISELHPRAVEPAPAPAPPSEDSIQQWIETVATGEINCTTPEVFAPVDLSGGDDQQAGVSVGPGEVAVRFNCAANEIGISFYRQSLVVAMVQPSSPAALNPNVRVGDSLVAVQGRSTAGMSYDEVLELLCAAGQTVQLTLKHTNARAEGGGVHEGGPVLIEGDLLKIEPNILGFLTGDSSREAHVRYFVVRADHITYIRSIGSEVVLPFSLIHDVNTTAKPPNLSPNDIAFSTPGEPVALFTVTMNEKYRKPFRVYMMQAPSITARDQWVRVCQQAKRDYLEFGPWRTRRNHDASSVKRCTVSRTRRVEADGVFERDFTLYIIEAETCGSETFQIERRYSDFVNFHQRWMEKVVSPYAALPELSRLDAIKDKNDPSIVIYRMTLLGSYIKAALSLAARLNSRLVTAALQHFLQAGASQNGDCEGAGCGTELEEGWDELSIACTGDDAGATYEILHSTFDVVGRWTFRAEGYDGLPDWSLYSLTCKLDGVAVFAAQGHPEARGRGVYAVGQWRSLDNGRRLDLEFETATDTTVPPPPANVDQVAAGGHFAVTLRKVCATQVFSVAGMCDPSNSGEFLAYELQITGRRPDCDMASTNTSTSHWKVHRRFTEFDELRKRLEAEFPEVVALNKYFPSKYSVSAGVELFDEQARTEGKVARRLNLGIWLQKVVARVPLHPGVVAFCQPQQVDGVTRTLEATPSIESVELLGTVAQNAGISWGVDDLDRRRYLVVERCVVGGKVCAQSQCLIVIALHPAFSSPCNNLCARAVFVTGIYGRCQRTFARRKRPRDFGRGHGQYTVLLSTETRDILGRSRVEFWR